MMPMHRYCILMAVCLLICIPMVANAAPRTLPAGSFVTKSVDSTGELVSLMKNDRVTAQRFANHFGMSVAELTEYFQKHLKMSYLSEPGTYTIYYRSKRGGVATRTSILPRGERVFIAYDGTPIILVKCGNPLAKHLPLYVKPVEQVLPPPPVPDVTEPVVAVPDPEPTHLSMEPVLVASLALPAEPIVETAVLADVLSLTEIAPYVIPALLGAVAVRSSNEPPVPEPTGLLALGLGASGAILTLRRRPRSKA
jgi:hypothetical protein